MIFKVNEYDGFDMVQIKPGALLAFVKGNYYKMRPTTIEEKATAFDATLAKTRQLTNIRRRVKSKRRAVAPSKST